MYQIGDCVIYGIHGVCRIVATEEKTVDRKKIAYFVLEPVDQNEARFFVPMHNEAAVSKIRKIMTADEINALLHADEVLADAWISDENQRKLCYRSLIGSGDRTALLRMIRSIHEHKSGLEEKGRKLHICDENFLKDAQKLLRSEFALVLQIPQEEVGNYIVSAIKSKE